MVSSPIWGSWPDFCYCNTVIRVCWCGAPSLTRGRVCRLQLLLDSPAQSFSALSPAGLMTISYCLRFETSPTWRARSQYLYPPGTEWSSYTPTHWVPFSLPPTTRKATVEVFEPASAQATAHLAFFTHSELLYDWRFTASQFALSPGSLRLTAINYFFFSTEPLRSESSCNILSDERMGLSFTIAAGPRQRGHSRVPVPRDSVELQALVI
jgi:hypothetical protein